MFCLIHPVLQLTVHIPVEAFNENPVVNVIILDNGNSIGSMDIELPEQEGKLAMRKIEMGKGSRETGVGEILYSSVLYCSLINLLLF